MDSKSVILIIQVTANNEMEEVSFRQKDLFQYELILNAHNNNLFYAVMIQIIIRILAHCFQQPVK